MPYSSAKILINRPTDKQRSYSGNLSGFSSSKSLGRTDSDPLLEGPPPFFEGSKKMLTGNRVHLRP